MPIGGHVSASDGIPAVLRILEESGVLATFFIEGWNAEHYPAMISALHAAGHEIGCHGWRHENWSVLGPDEARPLAIRALAALRHLGPPCVGLRPPGGALTRETSAMLTELGVAYVSPLGHGVALDADPVVLPFGWDAVDALYFEPAMSALRHSRLGRLEPCPDRDWRIALDAILANALAQGGVLTVIFHAYLLANHPERMATLEWFVRSCAGDRRITLHRAGDLAETLRSRAAQHV